MGAMISSKPQRLGRHFLVDHHSVRRRFSSQALKRIEDAIAAGERRHEGQVRFAVEASLPLGQILRGLEPRARALELFGRLGVWDTEHNSGVLIYVLLAERAIEIVADRGIAARVAPAEWQRICERMRERFAMREYQAGALEAIEAVSAILANHFPAGSMPRTNELPDEPVVL